MQPLMATTFHADRDGVTRKRRSKSRASNSRRKAIWRASVRVSVASCPCSSLATSSSWTISARTSRWQSGRWSEPPAQGSGICRHTRPFSILSNRPTLKSNTGCGRAQKRTLDQTWQYLGNLVPSLQRGECSNYFATARICFRQNLKRLELARHRSTGPAMRAVLAATAAASAALGITAWLQQSRLISDERPRLPCSRSTISPVTRSGTVGLSEHIISGLSHPRSLFLVARTSSEHQDTRPARKRSAGSLA
jgi:hypothetical protein